MPAPFKYDNLCREIAPPHCECLNKFNPKSFPLVMISDLTLHVSVVSNKDGVEDESHTVTELEGLVCKRCRRISVVGDSFYQLFNPTLLTECQTMEDLRLKLESIKIVDKEHKVSYDPKKLAMYNMSSATRMPIWDDKPLPEYKPYTKRLLSVAGHWRKVHTKPTLSTGVYQVTPDTAEAILSVFDSSFRITNQESFNEYVKSLDIRDADGVSYRLYCTSEIKEFSLRSKETRDRLIPFITLKLAEEKEHAQNAIQESAI